jgi:peptidoglycan hydrolase-like protein with peptidoglycan-binding domain
MKAKRKKATFILILISILLVTGTVVLLVYNRRKKNKDESVSQSVVSSISSVVTTGYIPETFPLRKGMYGDNVRIMQIALIFYGYSVGKYGSDGKFGNDTLTAVRSCLNKDFVTEDEWNSKFKTIGSVNSNLPQLGS